jgi:hypothetical protein
VSNGGLFGADGKRHKQAPQGVNFADQGWQVQIQDKETILAIHPNHPPVVLTSRGEVMQLEPESDKGFATAFLMVPQMPLDDPADELVRDFSLHFEAWVRSRAEAIQQVGGEIGGETPVTTQPAGEAP